MFKLLSYITGIDEEEGGVIRGDEGEERLHPLTIDELEMALRERENELKEEREEYQKRIKKLKEEYERKIAELQHAFNLQIEVNRGGSINNNSNNNTTTNNTDNNNNLSNSTPRTNKHPLVDEMSPPSSHYHRDLHEIDLFAASITPSSPSLPLAPPPRSSPPATLSNPTDDSVNRSFSSNHNVSFNNSNINDSRNNNNLNDSFPSPLPHTTGPYSELPFSSPPLSSSSSCPNCSLILSNNSVLIASLREEIEKRDNELIAVKGKIEEKLSQVKKVIEKKDEKIAILTKALQEATNSIQQQQ